MDPTTLLGIGVPALTLGIICISVICSLGFTAAVIYFVMRMYRDQRKRAEELMKVGTQGEATILSLQDTGMFVNNNPRVTVQLEIRLPTMAPYQLTKTMTVPIIRLAQVQTGSIVQVMVDMSDPTNPDKVGLLLK
ncbi:MAG TPA: hypothetical protein PKE62_11470 [Anaerolineales bacterium]|nr:hypothetical protein [Anaerolineales bacterium]